MDLENRPLPAANFRLENGFRKSYIKRMTKLIASLIFLFSLNAFAQPTQWQSGDLIFQTSNSRQAHAIMWASKSLYSHVGIIEVEGSKAYVVEAIAKVSRTPLEAWIARGKAGRYAVYRYDRLNNSSKKVIVESAKSHLGTGYDIYFTSHNNEIYCSELVDLAFRKASIRIGNYEKIRDLNIDNAAVRRLVQERWRKHPLCRSKVDTFDDCWSRILEDELITPESVSRDRRLKQIYSNYP